MGEELGVLTKHEVEKLMQKVSRERAKKIKELVTRAYALEVGGEFYQCFLSCLPTAYELEELLNDGSDMKFNVYQTINGFFIKREC